MLERLGYRADLAKNGREAVEALAQQPYDLILMDIQMPEMDGLQATRHIREIQPAEQQPRIVALTANAPAGGYKQSEISLDEWNRYQLSKVK